MLVDVTGLQNLISIGGEFWIDNNDQLIDLSPIQNLASVDGRLNIINNESLNSLSGLDNIATYSIINLGIYENPILSECDVFSICEYLVSPGGTIEIYNNASGCNSQEEVAYACEHNCLPEGIIFTTQEEIDNFQTNYPICTEIEGDVEINGQDVTNLNGLENLISIGGNLFIKNNDSLNTLNGINNLTTIGGSLEIRNNSNLTSLTSLENLTYIGGNLRVALMHITSLAGLENLSHIGGSISISFVTGLTNLTELENLSYIGGGISFSVATDLTSLTGLENVTSLNGGLHLSANSDLVSLTGLENLTSIGGDIYIEQNISLTSLTGLEGLTSIGGSLNIGDNEYGGNSALTSLTGLENLTSIGGDLEISRNDALTNLSGLENVSYLGGDLRITSNDDLTSLAGLDNIESNSIEDLSIHHNQNLFACEVQSVCDYLDIPNGSVNIHSNAPGCNSPEEVQEACWTSVNEIEYDDTFTISPNPNSGFVTLKYTVSEPGILLYELFDLTGTKVKSIETKTRKPGIYELEMDLSDLPAGIYFCVLKTNYGKQTKKIIKL